ncbi:MAG: Arm DNA-binding domain-containing protein, partial [Pseudomonadota bacterium]|nr:Arm DNA-binding domain-containing protein [Pseudomonadota bacterium]
MRLSKITVDRLPVPSSRYALYWDDKLSGFGLRVTPSGIKSFILQRRINGKEHRITLGRYGVLMETQVRREAQRLLG